MRKLIFLCLLLIGCAQSHNVIVPEKRLPLNLKVEKTLKLKPVSFIILTKDNAEKVLSQYPVLFVLTGSNYKAISYNIEEIKSYLSLQKDIILLYHTYYESEENLDGN